DAFIRQECAETVHHVICNAVLNSFERGAPALRSGEDAREAVLAWARDTNTLRARMLDDRGAASLARMAHEVRQRLSTRGTVLAFGNGGSATDATDLVADLRAPPRRLGLMSRRGLDLTEDPAILTALANDVGEEAVYARQVAALAHPNDV